MSSIPFLGSVTGLCITLTHNSSPLSIFLRKKIHQEHYRACGNDTEEAYSHILARLQMNHGKTVHIWSNPFTWHPCFLHLGVGHVTWNQLLPLPIKSGNTSVAVMTENPGTVFIRKQIICIDYLVIIYIIGSEDKYYFTTFRNVLRIQLFWLNFN